MLLQSFHVSAAALHNAVSVNPLYLARKLAGIGAVNRTVGRSASEFVSVMIIGITRKLLMKTAKWSL